MPAGQLVMMRVIASSGAQSMRAAASGPATRASAAAISPGVVDRAGRFMAVRGPQSVSLASSARIRPSMVRAGDESATGVSGGTGHTACSPASGSRTMPERKLDAAALGLPGRTLTVIRRTLRPRTKLLRVQSATNCSHMNFWMP